MPFSSSWSLMKCIANKQTLPYWKLGVDGIMRIANMCSLPMVFFLIQILNKRALLSRNEICRKYALFRIFFDSDLTQTIAIWLRLYSDICPKKWWLEPLIELTKFLFVCVYLVTLQNLLGASWSPPPDWLHHDAAYEGPPQHEVKTNYFHF